MEIYSGKSKQATKQCYQKQAEQRSVTAAESPPLLGGQLGDVVPRLLSSHNSTLLLEEAADNNGDDKPPIENRIQEGFLYEIDHVHLPPRTPVQLRSIRVAMVCEKTKMNVAVRYPSMESLRAFFNYSTRETHPALDTKFVMGTAVAARVLVRLVPTQIFSEQKSQESFWLISSSGFENKVNVTNNKGNCLSVLKSNGMLRWGVRRQVKYLGRHKESDGNDGNGQNSSSSFVKGVEESHVEFGSIHQGGSDIRGDENIEKDVGGDQDDGGHEEIEERNEGDEEDGDEEEEKEAEEKIKKSNKNSKRKRYSFRNKSVKKPKKEKIEVNKKQITVKKNKAKSRFKEAIVLRDPKDRWSAERYRLAEENLLAVMKAKDATAKKPILRPQLRAEARKRIGDTGLLDHLLKHMAGNLAPGGEERFRRRHNPDGAMEYWLEYADLVNIRREAGVTDPYWVPPPGWKPGDPPTQDPTCARELKLLKDDISKIKRHLELMVTKMQLEEEIGKLKRELQELAFEKTNESNQGVSRASSQSDRSQKLDQQLATSLMTSPKRDFDHAPVSVESLKKQLMVISDCLKKIEGKTGNPTPNLEGAIAKDPSLMPPTDQTHTKSKQQEVRALMATKEEPSKPCKDKTPPAQTEASPKAAETEKMATASPAAATAEEKAAKIQRLKSGFRLCKPQGTFLWPDMVQDNNYKSNSSSGKIMSPQVVVQVEVPTPPSVSSSTASAPPQLPYHHHHHSASLVKPLAEKRVVTLSTVSKVQDNKGTPRNHSSPTLIKLISPSTNAIVMPLVPHLSATANSEPWQNLPYGPRNETENDTVECNNTCCASSGTSLPLEVDKRLALPTFKSASDRESSHG